MDEKQKEEPMRGIMRTGKKAVLFIAFLSAILSIGWINRDLFHFEYRYTVPRTLSPETDAKGDTLLLGEVSLKPGNYELSFIGNVNGVGSGLFLTNGIGEKIFSFDLENGTTEVKVPFQPESLQNPIRIGIHYDPDHSTVSVEKILLTADHILYKESLTRHAVLTLFSLALIGSIAVLFCFPKLYHKLHIGEILFVLGISAAVSFPFFNSETYVMGEDLFFHLSRIEGIAQGLKAGYFPVRDQLFWLKNYGYGAGFFYPDIWLYFPALLRLLGFSLMSTYKAFAVLCTIETVGAFYFVGKRIGGNRICGVTASLFAAFSTYRLIAVGYRAGLGEMQAFIFAPFIVLGLYEIFSGHIEKWYWFAFGFWGVLNTHLITLFQVTVLTAVFLLWKLPQIFRDRKILFALLKSVLIVVLLGCAFWLPMLEQLRQGNLLMNVLLSNAEGGVGERFLNPVRNLFLFFHDWSYGPNFIRCVYPGLALLAVPLLRIPLCRKRSSRLNCADWMTGLSLVFLFMSTSAFPWRYLSWFLTRIQFSWRLLMPVSVLLSLSGAVYLDELLNGKKWNSFAYAAAYLAIVVCGIPVLNEIVKNRTNSIDQFWMQDNRVCGAEYMPFGLNDEFIDKNGDTVLTDSDQVQITGHDRQGLTFAFSWENAGEKPILFEVPLIHYKQFLAELTAPDGNTHPTPVTISSKGLVQVSSEGLDAGQIRVRFEKTGLQKISEWITLISFAGMLLFIAKKRRGN